MENTEKDWLSEDALSRRTVLKGALSAGFALAVQPVSAETIKTDSLGLEVGRTKFKGADGVEVPAYYAVPEKRGTQKPAVVLVVQEIFGVHEHIQDVCRRFAKQGYFAIAPDLYVRQGNVLDKPMNEIFPIVSKVPDAQVMTDLDAAVAYAESTGKADSSRLAITGFCWGGRIVWLYAAHNPKLKAGAAWYGRLVGQSNPLQPQSPTELAPKIKAPILGLYGAKDRGIPLESIEGMRAALKAAGNTKCEIQVYPDSEHGFHADYRPSYNEKDAKDGFAKLLAWFKKNGVEGTLAPPPSTQAVLDAAMKTASLEEKNLFIHFGASWCSWCRLLEKVIALPEVKSLLEANYVIVELVALESAPKKALENAGSNEFMKAMGGEKSGLPFLVFLDKAGKKLADSNVMPMDQNIGCPAAPEEIVAFGELLRKTAPRLTAPQRQTILDAFTKNAPKR